MIEIDKVRVSDISKLIHDTLRVIFRHRKLVQLHYLGSTSEQKGLILAVTQIMEQEMIVDAKLSSLLHSR